MVDMAQGNASSVSYGTAVLGGPMGATISSIGLDASRATAAPDILGAGSVTDWRGRQELEALWLLIGGYLLFFGQVSGSTVSTSTE